MAFSKRYEEINKRQEYESVEKTFKQHQIFLKTFEAQIDFLKKMEKPNEEEIKDAEFKVEKFREYLKETEKWLQNNKN